MADIEALRQANIAEKAKLLAGLNLNADDVILTAGRVKQETGLPTSKKRKLALASTPTRTSARLQNAPAPSYKDDTKLFELVDKPKRSSTSRRVAAGTRFDLPQNPQDDPTPIKDIEEIRAGWTSWTPTGQAPVRDEDGTFHFSDQPDFVPNKSPEEMLREGAFGGSYFRPLKSARLGIVIHDDWRELPSSWLEGLDVAKFVSSAVYDAEVNKYKVACGQSIEEWEAAGWIAHEFDVRGWFQWYCRFFMGRRCFDDERQVSRWKKCVGETGRWKRMLLKKYVQAGVKDVFDDGENEEENEVSPVMHQTCHHWAYEVRQKDLDKIWRSG